MNPAIEARGIEFSYGKKAVLRGVNLTVEAGETVVMTGNSGCGKTTLCGILCGIIPNAVKGRLSGSIRIMGADIAGRPLCETARTIGMVFQNADDQLIATTVEDELAFGPENLCEAPERIREAVDGMLRRFRLESIRLQNPARLSGGQKKLVTIAGALMLAPPILVLDEPMSGLDGDSRALVRRTIAELRHAGTTMLIVEHDPARFPEDSRVLTMREGRL